LAEGQTRASPFFIVLYAGDVQRNFTVITRLCAPYVMRVIWKRTLMSCQTCDDLLAACKRSARNHMNFVLNVSGAMGDDVLLASQEAARMARECEETRQALSAHRRQHGLDPSSKAASS
jgi:hypothetical protein